MVSCLMPASDCVYDFFTALLVVRNQKSLNAYWLAVHTSVLSKECSATIFLECSTVAYTCIAKAKKIIQLKRLHTEREAGDGPGPGPCCRDRKMCVSVCAVVLFVMCLRS